MKMISLLLAVTLTVGPVWSAQEPFYIGTYTRPGGSQSIYLSSLDTETGRLGPVTLAATASNPNRLSVLSIDLKTGRLQPTGQSVPAPSPVCVLFPRP
jgi:6-phosphogluconolactonase (cycloisomerase 2 family)